MRRPLGVAIAPDGKLWVTEETMNPKRTSVWEPDGAFVAEYRWPGALCLQLRDGPRETRSISIRKIREFLIDYHTGKTRASDGDCL